MEAAITIALRGESRRRDGVLGILDVADAMWLLVNGIIIPQRPLASDAPKTGGTIETNPRAMKTEEKAAEATRTRNKQKSSRPQREQSVAEDGEPDDDPAADLEVAQSAKSGGISTPVGGLNLRSPGARALPDPRALTRALRPLVRRVASLQQFELDEQLTAQRVAEERLWVPAVKPARVRWLDVALVIDANASMLPWQQTVRELRLLLERQGAFRDVRLWHLDTSMDARAILRPYMDDQPREAGELVDPTGRRLIIVITDGVGPAWSSGAAQEVLAGWGGRASTSLLSVLPPHVWHQTGLRRGRPISVAASEPAARNESLIPKELLPARARWTIVPVMTLQPAFVGAWAGFVRGIGGNSTGALAFRRDGIKPPTETVVAFPKLDGKARVRRFMANASPEAQKLAGLFAAAPLRLPVMRMIQRVMMPKSEQVHLAEVFTGGLMFRHCLEDQAVTEAVEYDFHDGVRDALIDANPIAESLSVLDVLSTYVETHLGQSLDFPAIIRDPLSVESVNVTPQIAAFARISAMVLRRLGGRYAPVADHLMGKRKIRREPFKDARILCVLSAGSSIEIFERHLPGAKLIVRHGLEEAVRVATSERVDAVVAQVGGSDEPFLGLEFLDELQRAGKFLPVALHVARGFDVRRQAEVRGAVAATSVFASVARKLATGLEIASGGGWPRPAFGLPDRLAARVKGIVLAAGLGEQVEHLLSTGKHSRPWEFLWSGERLSRRAALLADIVAAATDSGYVQVWIRSVQEWTVVAQRIDDGKMTYRRPARGGAIDRCAQYNELAYLPDVSRSAHFVPGEPTTACELVIPIGRPGHRPATGVINIESPHPYDFTPLQIEWLWELARSFAETVTVGMPSGEHRARKGQLVLATSELTPPAFRIAAVRISYHILSNLRVGNLSMPTEVGTVPLQRAIECAELLLGAHGEPSLSDGDFAQAIVVAARSIVRKPFDPRGTADLVRRAISVAIVVVADGHSRVDRSTFRELASIWEQLLTWEPSHRLEEEVLTELVRARDREPTRSVAMQMLGALGPLPSRRRVPEHWVLVVGSAGQLDSGLAEVAEVAGTALACGGFGLVSAGWPGVDETTSFAYLRRLGVEGAELRHWFRQVKAPGQPTNSVSGPVIHALDREDAVRCVLEVASAVVVISGGAGSNLIVREALKRSIPVLPIGGTGGFADTFFKVQMNSSDIRAISGLPRDTWYHLRQPSGVTALSWLLHAVVSPRSRRQSQGEVRPTSVSELRPFDNNTALDLTWSPKGRSLAAIDIWGQVQVWPRLSSGPTSICKDRRGDTGLVWSHDGRSLAVFGGDEFIRVYRASADSSDPRIIDVGALVLDADWSRNGYIAIRTIVGATVLDAQTPDDRHQFPLPSRAPRRGSICWCDSNSFATAGVGRAVERWSLKGEMIETLYRPTANVMAMAAATTAGLLAIGDRNGTVVVLDLKARHPICRLRGGSAQVAHLSFSADGRLLAICRSGAVGPRLVVHDIKLAEQIFSRGASYAEHRARILRAAWAHDRRLLAVPMIGKVEILDFDRQYNQQATPDLFSEPPKNDD